MWYNGWVKKIQLSKGKYALVDDADFEWLNQWHWHYQSSGYAVRTIYVKGSGRKNQKNDYVLMHRLINNTPIGYDTDHIDRDKLNNQRHNLRTADRSLNGINKGLQSNNTSGHKGVTWFKRLGIWQVYINKDGKRINLGYYPQLKDAVRARQQAESVYHKVKRTNRQEWKCQKLES